MGALASDLRNQLERVVIEARDVAEAGARAALEALAVHHHELYQHMSADQRKLRNHLRARARQLGDRQDRSGRLAIDHLARECAYEHWHRMLFARFLAENNLLIEPELGVAISLEEAEELAKDAGVDVWAFASRCAQDMLPEIFRPDDPLLAVSYATEHRVKLEQLLDSLPTEVFTASDSLGWVYQFWQSKRKDEVNRSEVKISADELPAVTQLFTEPYIVSFLIHNTLGAWWAGKNLTAEDAESTEGEEELRKKVALPGVDWEYLRFVRGEDGQGGSWRPAAGTFDGWPKAAKEIKVLDPCCGSGHFLVALLYHLVPIRMAEEGLSAREAVDAVLRDNLHGLEIDERCCQIAAFALAFAAWTYPDAGGYRELPELHIACSGIGPQCSADEWIELAEESGIPMPRGGREPIKEGLRNLHRLFSQAPVLGSLIDPTELPTDLIAADFETIQPYLAAIMQAEKADDATRERAIAAAGMVKAAETLAGEYTLVTTNVPYLGRGKQCDVLKAHLEKHFAAGKADLATAFVMRCLQFTAESAEGRRGNEAEDLSPRNSASSAVRISGTAALVTPQNWLFLTSYKKLRESLLNRRTWNLVARLGPGAFETISGHVVNVALLVLTANQPNAGATMSGLDVSAPRGQQPVRAAEKAALLRGHCDEPNVHVIAQRDQQENPDAVVLSSRMARGDLLSEHAMVVEGLSTGDAHCYVRTFWEMNSSDPRWQMFQGPPPYTTRYSGRESILLWENGEGALSESDGARIQGQPAWGRRGVIVGQMSQLKCAVYTGEIHDKITGAIIPFDQNDLCAIWAFCESDDYDTAIRSINTKLNVATATLVKVPFDLAHWQKVAAEKYPNGLPEPESDDPTQWLFHGWPVVKEPAGGAEPLEGPDARRDSLATLQTAVARLLGYRWPAELDEKMRLSKRARELAKRCDELLPFADEDGIVCIPSVRGEDPAAERLRRLLAAAFAAAWSAERERKLIAATGSKETTLDGWLRNDFFEQHCKLFHHRPFIWHIWDGRRRDGFHALVNYHKLAEGNGKGRRLLESLTYSYLGDWISRQKDGVKRGEEGAEERLAAALELQKRLEAILEGEPPFDIFVRWKPLHKQPIGWQPDINDGVRLNIRPFLASDLPKDVCRDARKHAGILRWKPNIHWRKDRGKEPERSKEEFPWFWGWDEKTQDFLGGDTFDGNRWNDLHYSNKLKLRARKARERR